MKDYEKLISEGKYDDVLDMTETDDSLVGLYYRLVCLIFKERFDEALFILDNYKKEFCLTLKKRKDTFKMHMGILLHINKPMLCFKEIEFYDSLPYEDYEFEELLKEFKESLMSDFNTVDPKKDSLEAIEEVLKHPDNLDNVIDKINHLRVYDVKPIMPTILSFLNSSYNPLARTCLLLILVAKESFEEVTFPKNGLIYTLMPYDLDPPFVNDYHQDVMHRIQSYADDPCVGETAVKVLNNYTIDIYPDNLFDYDKNDVIVAMIEKASEMLNIKQVSSKIASLNYNRKVVDALKENITDLELKNTQNLM